MNKLRRLRETLQWKGWSSQPRSASARHCRELIRWVHDSLCLCQIHTKAPVHNMHAWNHMYARTNVQEKAQHRIMATRCEGVEHGADWQEVKIRGRKRDTEEGERERRRTENKQERQRRGREKRREEGKESKWGIEGEKLRERGWELPFLAQIRENPA